MTVQQLIDALKQLDLKEHVYAHCNVFDQNERTLTSKFFEISKVSEIGRVVLWED